jgi:hypothetical protein
MVQKKMPRQILGGRILSMAMRLTGSQQVGYVKFLSRQKNPETGYMVSIYANLVFITAQVQGIDAAAKQYLGLDIQKEYIRVYSETPINELARDSEADRLIWGGGTYEVLSNNGWSKPQGFNGVMAVQI